MRFPGGTIANTYDWKRAIGDERGCQVDGRGSGIAGFGAVTGELAFGPDEFMEYAERIERRAADHGAVRDGDAGGRRRLGGVHEHRRPATGSTRTAASTGRSSAPANGHPEPYGVLRWEIGNEHHHLRLPALAVAGHLETAAQQYAFGGSRSVHRRSAREECNHPLNGVVSDGTRHQVFEVLYPPVDPGVVRGRRSTGGGGDRWPDVGATRPRARVFELNAGSGEVEVRRRGARRGPAAGKVRSLGVVRERPRGLLRVRRGDEGGRPVDRCVRELREGRVPRDAAAGLDFDCLTTHPITSLAGPGEDHATWVDALEGHDRMMLAADQRRRGISKLERALPDGTPLWFTEAAALQGDHAGVPDLGVLGDPGGLHGHGVGRLDGAGHPVRDEQRLPRWRPVAARLPASHHHQRGGGDPRGDRHRCSTPAGSCSRAGVEGNPVRQPEGMDRSYAGLAVTAIRDPEGAVQLLVVNRLPTDAVTARVLVDGQTSVSAELRTVVSDGFQASNRPGTPPEVTMEVTEVPVAPEGLVHTFPASSTTVIRCRPADRPRAGGFETLASLAPRPPVSGEVVRSPAEAVALAGGPLLERRPLPAVGVLEHEVVAATDLVGARPRPRPPAPRRLPGYLSPPAIGIVLIATQECVSAQATRSKSLAPGWSVPQSP